MKNQMEKNMETDMEIGIIELRAKGPKPEPSCRPLINKPPPLNRDYNRDPNIKPV